MNYRDYQNANREETLVGDAKRETLADKLSYLVDRLRVEVDKLDGTADRLFSRPSTIGAKDGMSGPTCLPATADRLGAEVERLIKLNEQMSEVA